jgi:CRP/FNR family transcriptional regulator, cyclic AMP receptor protein
MGPWRDGGVRVLVSDDVWAALSALGSERRFATGEVMLRQGDRGVRVYVLIDGRVKVTRSEEDGSEMLLAIRGAGEVVGELSVLDSGFVSATITALRPCLTRVIPGPVFVQFVQEHGLALPMFRNAAARWRENERIRIELGTLSVGRRLVRVLVRLMDVIGASSDDGVVVDLGGPQEELARAIGASRSQMAATLAELRDKGIVATARRQVVVRDPRRLRAIDVRPADSSGVT